MEFYTKYKRPLEEGEINDGISKVEKAGYVPAKVKIENLINAGQNLQQYRREQYDIGYGEKIDDNIAIDPTRKGLDLAEASEIANEVDYRLKQAEIEASQRANDKKGVEVPEKVQTPSEEASSISEDSNNNASL